MIPPKLPIFICHLGRAPRGFPDAALESADPSPPSPAQSEAGCPGQEPDRVPAPGGRARDAASSGPGTAGPFIVPGRAPSRRVRAASQENGAPRPRRQGEQGVACHPSGKLPPRPAGRLALDGPGPRTAGHPTSAAPGPPRPVGADRLSRAGAAARSGRAQPRPPFNPAPSPRRPPPPSATTPPPQPGPDSSPATSSGRFPKLNPFLCQLRAAPPRRQLSSPNFGARGPARRPGGDGGREGAAATSRRGAAAGPADGEDVVFTPRALSADAPWHGVRARHTPPPQPRGPPGHPHLAQVRDRGDGGRHRRRGRGRQGDVSLPARPGPARPGPGAPTAHPTRRRRRRCRARPSFLPAAGDAGGRARGQEPPPPPRKREREPFIEPPFSIGSHPATPPAAGQSERRRPSRGGAHWAGRRASTSANGRGEELRGRGRGRVGSSSWRKPPIKETQVLAAGGQAPSDTEGVEPGGYVVLCLPSTAQHQPGHPDTLTFSAEFQAPLDNEGDVSQCSEEGGWLSTPGEQENQRKVMGTGATSPRGPWLFQLGHQPLAEDGGAKSVRVHTHMWSSKTLFEYSPAGYRQGLQERLDPGPQRCQKIVPIFRSASPEISLADSKHCRPGRLQKVQEARGHLTTIVQDVCKMPTL
ncbi:translation initiation factor IF-2-like [Bubalus kerabau]|uniref:translation initiation factor IF-2-like n=1 Tax=Bubalus carabanensis TaxID=3119969 RepID=UPI00244E66B9|nr:translation initiation factor IF-2-like [Bubalus carabanensis]